jgi:hypothetical protein
MPKDFAIAYPEPSEPVEGYKNPPQANIRFFDFIEFFRGEIINVKSLFIFTLFTSKEVSILEFF